MFCGKFGRHGRKKIDASSTEPRCRPIQGDGAQVRAQESASNELAEAPAGSEEPIVLLNHNLADTPNLSDDSKDDHEKGKAGEIPSEELETLPFKHTGKTWLYQDGLEQELCFDLEKHRIFLSHSGAQKPFVDQLCLDLENAGHFPFFDRRPESLSKGEKFPELIVQAAGQCRVAVVVLSMDYLVSKWPMLELIQFMRERRFLNPNMKILPLFYKIGVDDLKSKHDRIMAVWRKRVMKDTRLNLKDFEDALKLLSAINGEVFDGVSEVEYRKAIVASICRLCPPDVQFDVSAMQGRDRLCDVVVTELDSLCTKETYARIVGVHGMGGSGKTLLCKALCNIYRSEFAGRVLHVELKGCKDSSKQENIIYVQRLILEVLTDASPDLLKRVGSVEQGNSSLYKRLRNQNVFMAIDNVAEENIEWVQILLHFLSPRSKAIVTSRSPENLKNVFKFKPITIRKDANRWELDNGYCSYASIPREKISCIQVPGLDKDEALKIFLHHAISPTRLPSTFTLLEMEVLETCIKRCFFPNKEHPVMVSDSRHMSGHYHPLSLQALGSYLKGIDSQEPLQWIQKSKILYDEKKAFYKRSVFDILRAGYDALASQQDQLIFLDIAVFAPRRKLDNLYDLCNWLSVIHGMDQETTLYKFKRDNLQRNALIEDWENNKTSKVTVHDLYVEFAEHQIHLEESQRWCVYETDGRTLPSCLKSNPPGLRWSSLVRLRLQSKSVIKFPYEKLLEWANLVVLDITLVQQKNFDISPLKCLRSLKLKSFILETLTWSEDMEELRYVKLSCERLVQEPDFSSCSNLLELNMRFANEAVCHERIDSLQPLFLGTLAHTLKVLQLTCCILKFPELLVPESLRNLEVLEIINDLGFSRHEGSFAIMNLSVWTQLRRLVLKNLPIRGSLPGLENLVGLEYLVLNRCRTLNNLPGLCELTNLQVLDVSATAIEELSGLERLLQLRGLYLISCNRLKSLPNLQSLASLKEVFITGCDTLSELPCVSESCTLAQLSHDSGFRFFNDFGDLWGNFIESFYYWTVGSPFSNVQVNFQLMLNLCPTAEYFDHRLLELEELREINNAFQEAFRIMHNMADAGRTKQEFDPKTDLIICSKIVSIVPKRPDIPYIRMMHKGAFDFVSHVRKLRALVKRHQT